MKMTLSQKYTPLESLDQIGGRGSNILVSIPGLLSPDLGSGARGGRYKYYNYHSRDSNSFWL